MNSLCISASLVLLMVSCASAQFGNIFGAGAGAVETGFGFQGDSLLSIFDNNAFGQQAALNKGFQNQEQIAANENLQVGANTAEKLQAADQTQANSALRAANQGNFANVHQIDGAANVNSASKTQLVFDNKNVYSEDAALSVKDANALEDNNIIQFQDQFANSNFLNGASQNQLQGLDQSQLGIAANNQNVLQVAEQVADQGQTQLQGADRSNFFGSNFDQSLFGGFGGLFRRR